MDWQDERYVRLYTRDTTTWKLCSWEARTVLVMLLRKVDRSGVIDVGADGVEGMAAVLELPLDLVELGLAQLIRRGVVAGGGASYVIPKFMEAQESGTSDRLRQKQSRERRRAESLGAVTACHSSSQPVTFGHSVPSCAVPSHAYPETEKPPRPPLKGGSATGGPTNSEPGMAGATGAPDETPVPEARPARKRRATGSVARLDGHQGHGVDAGDRPADAETAAPKGRTNSTKTRTVKALLHDEWKPSEELADEAKRQGVDLQRECERMRDWALSTGKRMVDWDATFRNWLRKAGDDRERRPPPWKERQTALGAVLEMVAKDKEKAARTEPLKSVIDSDMWRSK